MKKINPKKKKSLLKRLIKHREKPKKKQESDFQIMGNDEKKHFLSMDLIERLIRVEQRVGLSFGKEIMYNKTEYYRSLSLKEKQKFEKYLRTKGRKKYVLSITLLILMVGGFLFYNGSITGNVIGTVEEANINSFVGWSILGFIILGVSYLFVVLMRGFKRKKHIKGHFKILDEVFLNKYSTKIFR